MCSNHNDATAVIRVIGLVAILMASGPVHFDGVAQMVVGVPLLILTWLATLLLAPLLFPY